jgi:hypothetical protein
VAKPLLGQESHQVLLKKKKSLDQERENSFAVANLNLLVNQFYRWPCSTHREISKAAIYDLLKN